MRLMQIGSNTLRLKLGEILDTVANDGQTYIVTKGKTQVAVIMPRDEYLQLTGRDKAALANLPVREK